MSHSCAPLLLRSVFPALLLLGLTVLAPDARASSYSAPVYSGSGEIVTVSGSKTNTYPYKVGGLVDGYGNTEQGDGAGTVSSLPPGSKTSGAITTTFTWPPARP